MENYQPLEPIQWQEHSHIDQSKNHIGGHNKVVPADPQATLIMAQRLAKITGKPLEYCLKEFGYTMDQNANG